MTRTAFGSFALSFILMAGIALSSASAQTATTSASAAADSLGITLTATQRVEAGTPNALLALVTLTAGSGNAIQTSALPLSITYGNGLMESQLSGCKARNVLDVDAPLNSSSNGFTGGSNTISFASPLTIDAGRTVTVAIDCDVAATAPVGGTLQVGITPSTMAANVSGGGASVTPTEGANVSGGTGPLSGTVTIAAMSSIPTTPGTFIPGVPNTGLGSGVDLILLLVISGFAALAGATLLRRFV